MKSIRRKNLDELAKVMPVLSEKEQREFVGGGTVVIKITRSGYGENSTFGYFSAQAYDDNGQFITAITGVTLERNTDINLETVPNSGVAIAPDTYPVITGVYHGQSGYYLIDNVEGRTGIFFHAGSTYHNSTGCVLLGTSGSYNAATGNYSIDYNTDLVAQFNEFLSRYGKDGITLDIY